MYFIHKYSFYFKTVEHNMSLITCFNVFPVKLPAMNKIINNPHWQNVMSIPLYLQISLHVLQTWFSLWRQDLCDGLFIQVAATSPVIWITHDDVRTRTAKCWNCIKDRLVRHSWIVWSWNKQNHLNSVLV